MKKKWTQREFDGCFEFCVNLRSCLSPNYGFFIRIIQWIFLIFVFIPLWFWGVCIHMIFVSIYNITPMPLFELTHEQQLWCDENDIDIFDFTSSVSSQLRLPRMKCVDEDGVIRFRNEKQAMAFKLRWM